MAKIVLDGIEREVAIERTPSGALVRVDDRRYAVSDVVHLAGSVAFFIEQKSHVAYVSTGATGTRISLHGRTYVRTDARIDADAPSLTHAGDGRVEAPMPGAIIALHVGTGDAVKAGQPMVILESMKMHNEITAPMDGVVRRIHCKAGDQVGFGQLLAEITAA